MLVECMFSTPPPACAMATSAFLEKCTESARHSICDGNAS